MEGAWRVPGGCQEGALEGASRVPRGGAPMVVKVHLSVCKQQISPGVRSITWRQHCVRTFRSE